MNRELLKVLLPAILMVAAAFFVAYRFIEPAPPRAFTFAAGAEGGAYLAYARQYQAVLAREGIEVTILETAGSSENIALIESGQADVGLVQTGIPMPEEYRAEGLAALYYEPLWLFTRSELAITQMPQLAGLRVAVGVSGSGTRSVVDSLLTEHEMSLSDLEAFELTGDQLHEAMDHADLDAIFMVGGLTSASVQNMLQRAGWTIAEFKLATALARRLPYLEVVTVPRGLLNPASDLPERDLNVLSPVASLVAHSDFHPALVDLLLTAAQAVHANGDILSHTGTFPGPAPVAAPLSAEADRFFSSGLPFLKRVLPFWAATLIARAWVMIIPLLTILIPLFKILPPAYHWRLRSQLFRLYKRLKAIDQERIEQGNEADVAKLLAGVEAIENETQSLTVPLSYADRVYQLKLHTRFVRDQLTQTD